MSDISSYQFSDKDENKTKRELELIRTIRKVKFKKKINKDQLEK